MPCARLSNIFAWILLVALFCPVFATAHTETQIAIDELTALIARAPRQPSLWISRSGHYRDHGLWKEAEADLIQAERLDPTWPELDVLFARLFIEADRPAEALLRVERALKRAPGDPTCLILRARLHAHAGNATAAATDFSAALAALPVPRPEIFLERAALPIDPAAALAGLNEGIARIGPALVLMDRALALELQLGRNDDALRRLADLTATAERKEFWLKRRGDLLQAMGRFEDARQAYADALAALQGVPDWLRQAPDITRMIADLKLRLAKNTVESSPRSTP